MTKPTRHRKPAVPTAIPTASTTTSLNPWNPATNLASTDPTHSLQEGALSLMEGSR